MTVHIQNSDDEWIEYWTVPEILEMLNITRQTLWRWRKTGKIPRGRLWYGKQRVYTQEEVKAIRNYRNRME